MTARAWATALLLFIWYAPQGAEAVDLEELEKLPSEKRIEEYEKLLEEDSVSIDILFKLGNAYYDAGKLEEAVARFRGAWTAGGPLKVFFNLAYVLSELGRREEARQAFADAVERLPESAVLHAHYGDFLSDEGDSSVALALAIDEYRRALYLDENCIEACFGLGVLFARAGIYKEAIVEWERTIAIDSTHHLARKAEQNIERARHGLQH